MGKGVKHQPIYHFQQKNLDLSSASNDIEKMALKITYEKKKITLEELYQKLKTIYSVEIEY